MARWRRLVSRASAPVSRVVKSFSARLSPFFSTIRKLGNSVKIRKNAKTMPSVISQPKSMTGRMPLASSDTKATMVVSEV